MVNAFQLKGQALLSSGNFLALMFFVLAIGNFAVYFVLGWTTNVIAQVSKAHIIYVITIVTNTLYSI